LLSVAASTCRQRTGQPANNDEDAPQGALVCIRMKEAGQLAGAASGVEAGEVLEL
jgi:hypothetical protein